MIGKGDPILPPDPCRGTLLRLTAAFVAAVLTASLWFDSYRRRLRLIARAMDQGYALSPEAYEDLIKRGPFGAV